MSRKKSLIECICPKCGATHKMSMMWTGRGKPRKYCPNCKSGLATINSVDVYGVSSRSSKP